VWCMVIKKKRRRAKSQSSVLQCSDAKWIHATVAPKGRQVKSTGRKSWPKPAHAVEP
jgi:hypothetical protein